MIDIYKNRPLSVNQPNFYAVFDSNTVYTKAQIQNWITNAPFNFFESNPGIVKLNKTNAAIFNYNYFYNNIRTDLLYYIDFNDSTFGTTNQFTFEDWVGEGIILSAKSINDFDVYFRNGDTKYFSFPNLIDADLRVTFINNSRAKVAEFDSLLYISSSSNDGCFYFSGASLDRFYTPKLDLTTNVLIKQTAGNVCYVKGDYASTPNGTHTNLDYLRNNFTEVRYVTNFDAPNKPTNVTYTKNSQTEIQINFTAPVPSTNAVDFYELYIFVIGSKEEFAKRYIRDREIQNGEIISDLEPNKDYCFFLKTVDYIYNKSEPTNDIKFKTD